MQKTKTKKKYICVNSNRENCFSHSENLKLLTTLQSPPVSIMHVTNFTQYASGYREIANPDTC